MSSLDIVASWELSLFTRTELENSDWVIFLNYGDIGLLGKQFQKLVA
jgi:hypothetical protein